MGACRADPYAYRRQGLQDRTDPREERFRSNHRHTLPRLERMVLYQYPGQPRRSRARRACQLPHQGGEQALYPGDHPQARRPARPLRPRQRRGHTVLSQGAHQLLSAAQRQQGGMGQHRHLRMDGLSYADQDQLPLPRLYPCRSIAARPLPAERPRSTCRTLRHTALPQLLPQGAYARLHQGRGTRQPPLSAVHHAEERHPRNGRLRG